MLHTHKKKFKGTEICSEERLPSSIELILTLILLQKKGVSLRLTVYTKVKDCPRAACTRHHDLPCPWIRETPAENPMGDGIFLQKKKKNHCKISIFQTTSNNDSEHGGMPLFRFHPLVPNRVLQIFISCC